MKYVRLVEKPEVSLDGGITKGDIVGTRKDPEAGAFGYEYVRFIPGVNPIGVKGCYWLKPKEFEIIGFDPETQLLVRVHDNIEYSDYDELPKPPTHIAMPMLKYAGKLIVVTKNGSHTMCDDPESWAHGHSWDWNEAWFDVVEKQPKKQKAKKSEGVDDEYER